MAAAAVLGSCGPALCPSFAEVCSFLERYGAALDLPEMNFTEMERYLRDTTTGEEEVYREREEVGKEEEGRGVVASDGKVEESCDTPTLNLCPSAVTVEV